MPPEPGKKRKPPPARADALKIDLPLDEAIKAALEAKPPPELKRSGKRRNDAQVPPDQTTA